MVDLPTAFLRIGSQGCFQARCPRAFKCFRGRSALGVAPELLGLVHNPTLRWNEDSLSIFLLVRFISNVSPSGEFASFGEVR